MNEASPEREAATTDERARGLPGRASAGRRKKRTGRAPGEPRNVAYLYILPGLAFYLAFTFLPLLQTVRLSFYDWDGLTPKKWIGVDNYRELWNTPDIHAAFQHSFTLILFYAVFSIVIGLFITALLTRFRVRGFLFYRTVLFMPQTIATVVVAQAFVWIYAPEGPLNEFLDKIGLGSMARSWLGSFEWALPSVGLIGTWITFGLCIVLFLAGAQRIPFELYEAARVDGAGFLREFFAVTLPGLRNELVVAATLTTITALRNFDIIYNTTSGGPGGETTVPSWLMFHNAFDLSRVGFAASIAVVLTVIITCIALLIGRLFEVDRVTGRLDRYATYVVLSGFALLALYPMVSILSLAFHKKDDLVTGFSLPTSFSLDTFTSAWEGGDFSQGMWGSFLVATTVTAVSAVLSLFTGYAFGTMRFRGSNALFYLIVVGLIFPYEATVIPLYYDFLDYHPAGISLAGSYWALILPQIGQSVTLGTFWMRAFFLSTPRALVEAGRIDGAGSFRILRSVLLPQARPALLTLCLLVFVYTWNEFLLALVLLAGSDNTTAPLGLAFFAGVARASDPTKVAAASVLVALPIVVVYLVLQRHFIRGVLAGAIKE